MMIDVTDELLNEHLQSADTPTLLYVWAPWCGPCKMVGAALERMQEKGDSGVQVAKANMENFQHSATHLEIRTTPTLILFQQGKEIGRRCGAVMESQIRQWLKQSLGGVNDE